MEPEVSSTKTSSFGVISAGWTRSGGCSIRVKKPRVLGEHGVFHALARDVVLEDEILVRDDGLVAQLHDGLARVGALDRDIVSARFQAVDGHAGVQVHLDRDVVPGARALGRHVAERDAARRPGTPPCRGM